jgi:hypothetical protein
MTRDEFRLVKLLEPARSCVTCVFLAGIGASYPHAAWHNDHATRLPRTWRVVGPVRGDPIALGTTLRLVSAQHQVFPQDHQALRAESIQWLFAPIDGPQVGEVYHVWTYDERDEDSTEVVPRGVAGDPRWPTGLDAVP